MAVGTAVRWGPVRLGALNAARGERREEMKAKKEKQKK